MAHVPSTPIFPDGMDADVLRRNQRRFEALTRTFGDLVWLADADGGLTSDIPAWRAFTGQTVEELLGDGWLDAVHPDDREHADRVWQAALASRSRYEVRYRITGQGQERWFQVRAAPVLDDAGAVVEWVGTAVDVTAELAAEGERDRLAAQVDREREVLEQVVARAPSAIAVLLGPEHDYWLWNEAYTGLVPAGRLRRGVPLRAAIPEAVESTLPLFDRAFRGEEVVLDHLRVPFDDPRSYDGHRHYRGHMRPLTQDGRPIGVLVTIVEITEDVRLRDDLEAQLAAERQLAERMQTALLPDTLPAVEGLDFAQRYLTASAAVGVGVGGDWYDVLVLDARRVLVTLGDISGRGLRAASEMSQVRAALRAYANAGAGPAEILERTAALARRTSGCRT